MTAINVTYIRELVNMKSSIIWDGSEASTLEIIRMLGDDVGDLSIDRDKFSDYVQSVQHHGISHKRLDGRILKVGDTLELVSLVNPEPSVIDLLATKRDEYIQRAGEQFDRDLNNFATYIENMKSLKFQYGDRVTFDMPNGTVIGIIVGVANLDREDHEAVVYKVVSSVEDVYLGIAEDKLTATVQKTYHSDGSCPAVANIFGDDTLIVNVELYPSLSKPQVDD